MFTDFVVNGQNDQKKELQGSLEFLDPTTQEVLGSSELSDQQAKQNWTVIAAADEAPTKPRRRTAVADAQLEGDQWLTHDVQLDRRVAEAHGQFVDVDLQRHRNVE